jgi:tritrans,polycis-undecaprenyl-diphosphate synthase [geranylgeranyl-diphosphate specific]
MLESIAFIPDGNRRYARKASISFLKAYQLGTQKAWDVMHWLEGYDSVKSGTFWMLSLENMQKRKAELGLLFHIFDKELARIKNSGYFEQNQIRVRFFGRLDLLPKKLLGKVKQTEDFTRDFEKRTINLALGYSGRAEIVDAAKRLALDVQSGRVDPEKIDEKSFAGYLYADLREPDLLIRTSGEQRTSGFLPFQSAYSELFFCRHYWPEFSRQDLDEAIADFGARQRNFGR